MKISLASDIHLEFGYLNLDNSEESDILILAGDILVASDFKINNKRSETYREFIENVTNRYGHIVYIMGNHEHYHGDYAKTADILRDEFKYFNNLKFLDNNFVDICDVRFIGGTLWTDLNKNDPLTFESIKRSMNDYQVIENSNIPVNFRVLTENGTSKYKTKSSIFSPSDSYEDHKRCVSTINEILNSYQDDKKVIVVTHHLPTHKSVPREFARDFHGNGAYASDLSEFILDRPQIKYWVHGHTHDPCDYMIGDTRVICNPRGYIGYERIANTFKVKQFEI